MAGPTTDADGQPSGSWGVHFTPQLCGYGHGGRVYLLDRSTGRVLTTTLPSSWACGT